MKPTVISQDTPWSEIPSLLLPAYGETWLMVAIVMLFVVTLGGMAKHLQTLENIGRFRAQELLLVGGGSRNALWNQIKADRLGIPIKVLDDAETTVAGAAMFGWYGVGEFSSPEQARAQVAYRYRYFWPQTEPELTEEA